MEIGSELHKELFCRSIIETHRAYDPAELPWPRLEDASLNLIRSIPFWEEALEREQQAGRIVSAYAERVSDPLVREAIAVQGVEETRHARLLAVMIEKYDIPVTPRPAAPLPVDLEDAFYALGYEECLDSFFAFGMYKLASRAQIFPNEIFQIFSQLIDEEARHNLYFVNWASWHQINKGEGFEPLRNARALWYYGLALSRLVSGFASGSANAPGFTASGMGALSVEITPQEFLDACIEQQNTRMAPFDSRLERPQLMPTLAGTAAAVVKLFSPQPVATASRSA